MNKSNITNIKTNI